MEAIFILSGWYAVIHRSVGLAAMFTKAIGERRERGRDNGREEM